MSYGHPADERDHWPDPFEEAEAAARRAFADHDFDRFLADEYEPFEPAGDADADALGHCVRRPAGRDLGPCDPADDFDDFDEPPFL